MVFCIGFVIAIIAAFAVGYMTGRDRTEARIWDATLGIAPNCTGDLSSEEFVRNLRDEWRD